MMDHITLYPEGKFQIICSVNHLKQNLEFIVVNVEQNTNIVRTGM